MDRRALQRMEVVSDEVAAILRRKTPAERVAMALDLNRLVRLRIEGHLRSLHTDWNDDQIAAEVARRMLLGSS